jgi:excisionase family DNA binding protein
MPETRSTPNPPTDEILTVREVADYLRLGESTIYRLAQEGKLPGRKIGGTWRFSRQAITIWFREYQALPILPLDVTELPNTENA